jgi:hypothetical protein
VRKNVKISFTKKKEKKKEKSVKENAVAPDLKWALQRTPRPKAAFFLA